MIIRVAREKLFPDGRLVSAHEKYPSDSEWGHYGWSFPARIRPFVLDLALHVQRLERNLPSRCDTALKRYEPHDSRPLPRRALSTRPLVHRGRANLRGSSTWVVFHHTETDFLVREGSRFLRSNWELRQATLPSPTFAGILERLETVSIPLLATPESMICDGTISGLCLNRGEQTVLVTWYNPPKKWQALENWYCQTRNIFGSLSYQR